jgi:hypothetical protein
VGNSGWTVSGVDYTLISSVKMIGEFAKSKYPEYNTQKTK